MKANPRRRTDALSFSRKLPRKVLTAASLTALVLVAACVPAAKPPVQAPRPAPTPAAPPPPAPPPPPADWRDSPATPGDWRITSPGIASFADGIFGIRCNRASSTISLFRSGTSAGPVSLSITTSDTTRAVAAHPVSGGVQVDLPARDRLLDSMAFSRGRFAVQAQGMQPLYIPSWTEISRVIEDCR
ncbi:MULTISPECIES: hypothetical protein [unclassified Novosphingobium]|jgi:hypothetical protein|uniref:hypothetical protein n=1 Tax=unclassified Novosphingobium TaxID=2644732 RepID=UPI001064EA80|nr:hypothetical protein [Novosphingobium sp. PhB55]TDW68261.1 hypothetical protein EDF57_101138 [Novosphingobium sp. PhB55]